jgi:hypothetical protein
MSKQFVVWCKKVIGTTNNAIRLMHRIDVVHNNAIQSTCGDFCKRCSWIIHSVFPTNACKWRCALFTPIRPVRNFLHLQSWQYMTWFTRLCLKFALLCLWVYNILLLQTYMQLELEEVIHLANYYWVMMDSGLKEVMSGTLFAWLTKRHPIKRFHFNTK